ncbi:MAG: RnfABCDGE type electron transport complex subunit G [Bacteroidales bacterium]|nr:RnfABCDGE type electron transport complex subunit G [Candidatus Scybalousia scybalohippi]
MAKLESTMKNMVLSLSMIALVASGLLGGVYALTKGPIDQATKNDKEKAIKAVLPDKSAVVGNPEEVTLPDYADPFVIYPATVNGELVGAAVETYDKNGYGGTLKVMVGLKLDGTVSDYSILETSETPGLGAKAEDWFRAKGDIRGKNPATSKFTPTKDGGDIDAITASTITSRAFLTSVQKAYEAFLKYQNK